MKLALALILTVGCLSGQTRAATLAALPFAPPLGFSLEASTRRDAAGNPVEYGATGTQANWTVSQWATMQDIGKLSPVANTTNQWTGATSDSYVNVNMSGSTPVQTVAQDGASLPCLTAGGAPYEFDLFMAPNTISTSSYPTGLNTVKFSNVNALPTMAQVTSLPISGQYVLSREFADTRGAACDVNQSIALISLVFTDKQTTPYQVFYYQLQISQLCVAPHPGVETTDYSSCLYYQENAPPFWFEENAPAGKGAAQWGFDDYITSYGHSLMVTPGAYQLTIDPAARVKGLIANNSAGMDKVLGNWKMTGYYIGQQVWGGCYLKTVWSGFVPSMVYSD
jgi:hypothetical protein